VKRSKPSVADLLEPLAAAAASKDPVARHIEVAAILGEALRRVGQEVVLVGGAAVELYTEGEVSTADLDLLAEGGPPLRAVMKALGFASFGKDWIHEPLGLYVEFPRRALGPSEQSILLRVNERSLRVVSREDLLVDRLCAFKFWCSAIDGVTAMLLVELGDLDDRRLRERAAEEDVADALATVQEVHEEVVRRRLSRSAANALLVRRMRALRRR
jgi:hypothetical protein